MNEKININKHKVVFSEAVLNFIDETSTYWLADMIKNFYEQLLKIGDCFYSVKLVVDEYGNFECGIRQEVKGHWQIMTEKGNTELPAKIYKFFISREENTDKFTVVFPSEYPIRK